MAYTDLIQSETKRKLLQLIKRRGEITLDDAIEATGYTRPTLRDHLNQMGRDGLVKRRSQRHGRGRPRMCYRMGPMAEQLFPRRDGVLFAKFLRYLEEEGESDLIEDFFASFWEERMQEVEHRLSASVEDASLEERLDALETVLDEEGFMPEIYREEGQITIRECNCPFADTVEASRRPCKQESCFYEELFDLPVERVSHIAEGDPACTYEVQTA